MRFLGELNFYRTYFEKLNVNCKPFYDVFLENTPCNWTSDHDFLFQLLKTAFTSYTELTIPKTKHPFFLTVEASLIGLGAVFFELIEDIKRNVISYNSRLLYLEELLHQALIRFLRSTLFHRLLVQRWQSQQNPNSRQSSTNDLNSLKAPFSKTMALKFSDEVNNSIFYQLQMILPRKSLQGLPRIFKTLPGSKVRRWQFAKLYQTLFSSI